MKQQKHFIKDKTYEARDMLGYDIMHRTGNNVGYHYKDGNKSYYVHGSVENRHVKVTGIHAEGIHNGLEEICFQVETNGDGGRKYG